MQRTYESAAALVERAKGPLKRHVLHDVLNRIDIDAVLARGDAYEVDLAIAHLAHTRPNDLLLFDRNYPSYRMLATCLQNERNFVMRCSAASFSVARLMLKGEGAGHEPDRHLEPLCRATPDDPRRQLAGNPYSALCPCTVKHRGSLRCW